MISVDLIVRENVSTRIQDLESVTLGWIPREMRLLLNLPNWPVPRSLLHFTLKKCCPRGRQ